jgi:hypothetical protein
MANDTPVTCPRCASSSVQAVSIQENDVTRAMLTELSLGTAAGVTAGSRTIVQALCLKCGLTWFPGSPLEHRIRALSGQLGPEARDAEAKTMEAEARAARARRIRSYCIAALVIVLVVSGIIALTVWYGNRSDKQERAARLFIWRRDSTAAAQEHRLDAFLKSKPRPDAVP